MHGKNIIEETGVSNKSDHTLVPDFSVVDGTTWLSICAFFKADIDRLMVAVD